MGEEVMKVSVIVPVYNGVRYITRCVESILCQLGRDMELIIVDDASTDGTFDLLKSRYKNNEKVALVRCTVNHGAASARNTGIKLARGEYIAFCDADDEWANGKLKRQMDWFELRPDAHIVFVGIDTVLEEKTARTEKLASYAKLDKIHLCTALISKAVFRKIGLLDEKLRIREDTEWLVRARCSGYDDAYLDEPLYIRHVQDDGLSAGVVMENDRKERVLDAFVRGIRRKPLPEKCRYDISILIPVFNAEKYIKEAIDSCVSENYSNELIIIDDGSVDNSFDVLSRIIESRECGTDDGVAKTQMPVTYITRCHKGQAFSRNDAFNCSDGKYILYLDADDFFTPGAIDILMNEAVNNPDILLVSALCRDFVSPELKEEEASKLIINRNPYRRMLAGCMLAKRELFDMVGTFDESMPTSETAQWVMRIRDAGIKTREIDNVVLCRRHHNNNLGRLNRQAQMNSYITMIRNRLKNK